jgi:hypothetical protein
LKTLKKSDSFDGIEKFYKSVLKIPKQRRKEQAIGEKPNNPAAQAA